MSRQHSTEVPPDSYARLLTRSKASCASDPTLPPTFVKIRVTPADPRGAEGLVGSDELEATINSRNVDRRETTTILASEMSQRDHYLGARQKVGLQPARRTFIASDYALTSFILESPNCAVARPISRRRTCSGIIC